MATSLDFAGTKTDPNTFSKSGAVSEAIELMIHALQGHMVVLRHEDYNAMKQASIAASREDGRKREVQYSTRAWLNQLLGCDQIARHEIMALVAELCEVRLTMFDAEIGAGDRYSDAEVAALEIELNRQTLIRTTARSVLYKTREPLEPPPPAEQEGSE